YIKQLLGTSQDPVLANCWFWLAQYSPTAVVPPNWDTWTLWQYTDGAAGPPPHDVPGAGLCDRDKFNGDEPALRSLWGAERRHALFTSLPATGMGVVYSGWPACLPQAGRRSGWLHRCFGELRLVPEGLGHLLHERIARKGLLEEEALL